MTTAGDIELAIREFVDGENRTRSLFLFVLLNFFGYDIHHSSTFEFCNQHIRSVPIEICQLQTLLTLNLSGNELTSLPNEIGQLHLLCNLYVDRNRLESLPAQIEHLLSLEFLMVSDNQLQSLPLHSLVKLPKLRYVSYWGNPLKNVSPIFSLQYYNDDLRYPNIVLEFARERRRLGAALLAVLSSHRSTMQFAEPVCVSIFRHVVNDLIEDDELVRCVHRMCVACARIFSRRNATRNV